MQRDHFDGIKLNPDDTKMNRQHDDERSVSTARDIREEHRKTEAIIRQSWLKLRDNRGSSLSVPQLSKLQSALERALQIEVNALLSEVPSHSDNGDQLRHCIQPPTKTQSTEAALKETL